MIKLSVLILSFILINPIIATAEQAQQAQQPACYPHNIVVDMLKENAGEVLHAIGVNNAGTMVEIWRNKKTGTFTITATEPNTVLTCPVTFGTGYTIVDEPIGLPINQN